MKTRCSRIVRVLLAFVFLLLGSAFAFAQTPQWIWHQNDGSAPDQMEVRYFRKSFDVRENEAIEKAELLSCGDDELQLYLNEKLVAEAPAWVGTGFRAQRRIVTRDLRPGRNILAARIENSQVTAGLVVKLEITYRRGDKETIVTDGAWLSSAKEEPGWSSVLFQDTHWARAFVIGEHGRQPWGDILSPPIATAAEQLVLLPGFKAELLRSAVPGEGSWVCMTVDNRGRLIVSPQERLSPNSGGMLRITLDSSGQVQTVDPIESPVGAAMGLLHAFDSLYVSGAGPNGIGLYRLRDLNGDDQYESIELLKEFPGGTGEHGAHAILLGPDQKLWIINGNSTPLPGGISSDSPFRNYAEDDLLPRVLDPVAPFFDNIKSPYGYVLRTDPDGKKWELIAAGFRNPYDMDFNADGELFTFDSDMEWDVGLPWYRPTRVLHIVSGAEFGFREGSAKWPDYYEDSLPAAVDIGLASPTGVKFGTKSRFPAKYQKAFFAMDWTYGRILAVHLAPAGSSYTGSFETFVSGKPLPVTDLEFGQDGAMYFITGGRGTQSGLYRVRYDGAFAAAAPQSEAEKSSALAREQRHKLEAFHGKRDSMALQDAWPFLGSTDRWLRYAARLAVESQDTELWAERALGEMDAGRALAALLALARAGGETIQAPLLDSLAAYEPHELDDRQKVEALRILEISFARMGSPEPETVEDAIAILNSAYPSSNSRINRDLALVLAYLDAPDAPAKTLQLMKPPASQEDQIHFALALRGVKRGWTLQLRLQYFEWFNRALREYKGGNSFGKFLEKIRREAIAAVPENERAELAGIIPPATAPAAPRPDNPPPQREFVRDWLMSDLTVGLDKASRGRSFERGRRAFIDSQCLACHRFQNEGGSVGPDITAAANRFNRRELLEAIIEPSKIISDQYLAANFILKDSSEISGLIVEENEKKLSVLVNPLTLQQMDVLKSDIVQRSASRVSPMPAGLANFLTEDEIFDLLAYIESAGNPAHPAFKRQP